jgi:hypothetical protein
MAFKFFTVPIQDDGTAAAELNGFLRSHRVLSVDRRWVEQGASFWCFCIDYLEPSSGGTGPGRAGPVPRGKVDYKDVLSAEEFAVFARLREVRKQISASEAVPVYTISTNEELAHMVQAKAPHRAALEKIAGVGDARIEKYGARMLEVLFGLGRGRRMKRAGSPFERALDRDNLRSAVGKAMRGKRDRPDVVAFLSELDHQPAVMAEQPRAGRSLWAGSASSSGSTPRSG